MSKQSLRLQAKSLREMASRKPYVKKLAGFEYDVLPRVYKGSTDTELFCRLVRAAINGKKGRSVWDIGTGTGLIALSAKKKGARYVLATDLNPDAVKNAKANGKRLGLRIDVRLADVFGSINRRFDIITFNPPFTDAKARQRHEISFWDEGHKAVRKFFKGLKRHLKPGGRAFIAWASFADTKALIRIAKEFGWSLRETGKKRGKRGFVYYVFEVFLGKS
jgi:release factor glutamine methyltransferase